MGSSPPAEAPMPTTVTGSGGGTEGARAGAPSAEAAGLAVAAKALGSGRFVIVALNQPWGPAACYTTKDAGGRECGFCLHLAR